MEVYESDSEAETLRIAQAFGSRLRPPATILLTGGLGAGKTVFTKGIVTALGVPGEQVVRSPSFSLVNVYDTPHGRVYHVDLYRLESSYDLQSIGFEEILADPAIVIVEWAERLAFPIPGAYLVRIEIDPVTDKRRVEIESTSG